MFPSAGDELDLKPMGFLVAITAFVYTRVSLVDVFLGEGVVTLRTLASLVPLVLGFGVVVFGVTLAVSTHDRAYVRTVGRYFFASTAAMLLLVGVGAVGDGRPILGALTSGPATSTVVAGGAGGLVLGVIVARNHRQRRALRHRTEQATLLNRLLRHELLNSLTAIRGYADILADGGVNEEGRAAVGRSTDRIERVVEDVRFLSPSDEQSLPFGSRVALERVLANCRDGLADTELDVEFPETLPATDVRADEHLETVVHELVTTASTHVEGSPVSIDISVDRRTVTLSVSAPGEWLSEVERAALLDGPPEYDDPRLGYGVSIVRQLVTRYGGQVAVEASSDITTVDVTLSRTASDAPTADDHGLDTTATAEAVVAGLLGGVVMGAVLQGLSGEMGVIGSLYGVRAPLLGWTVHLFHSVVFAIVAATVWRHPSVYVHVGSLGRATAVGGAYGLVLWFLAAGLLMPLWLSALDVPTAIPNLDPVSMLAHLVWGVSVSSLLWGLADE